MRIITTVPQCKALDLIICTTPPKENYNKNGKKAGRGGTHLWFPALGRQRQVDLLSSRPTWSTKQVPEQPGVLHRETLPQNTNEKLNTIFNP